MPVSRVRKKKKGNAPARHRDHMLIRGILSPDQLAELQRYAFEQFDADERTGIDYGEFCTRPHISMPASYKAWIFDNLNRVAHRLRALPTTVTEAECAIVRYRAGEGFPEHTDYDDTPRFRGRRVAFVVPLSERGTDYTGGYLRIRRVASDCRAGDLVGFTALTPHDVTPVETGERMVVIGFGYLPGTGLPATVDPGTWHIADA